MRLSEHSDNDLINELAERGIEVIYMKTVEEKLAGMEKELKSWKEEEVQKRDWNGGYNDGFEGAIISFRQLIR